MENNFEIVAINDNNIEIKKYFGEEKVLFVPEKIDGKTVKRIGRNCFANNKKVTEIYIPNSVTEIKSGAFNKCTKLKRVFIGDGIEKITDEVFNGCKKLEEVLINSTTFKVTDDIFLELDKYPNIFTGIRQKDKQSWPNVADDDYENNYNVENIVDNIITGYDYAYDSANKKIIKSSESFSYYLNEKGEAIIAKPAKPFKNNDTIVLDNELDGHIVVGIAKDAFYECEFRKLIIKAKDLHVSPFAFNKAHFDFISFDSNIKFVGNLLNHHAIPSNLGSFRFYDANNMPNIYDFEFIAVNGLIKDYDVGLLSNSSDHCIIVNKLANKDIADLKYFNNLVEGKTYYNYDLLTIYCVIEEENDKYVDILASFYVNEKKEPALLNYIDGYEVKAVDTYTLNTLINGIVFIDYESWYKSGLCDDETYKSRTINPLLLAFGNTRMDPKSVKTIYENTTKIIISEKVKRITSYLGYNYDFVKDQFELPKNLVEICDINFGGDFYILPDTVKYIKGIKGAVLSRKTDKYECPEDDDSEIKYGFTDFICNDNFTYSILNKDGENVAYLFDVKPKNGNVVIPQTLDGCEIKGFYLTFKENIKNLYIEGDWPVNPWTEDGEKQIYDVNITIYDDVVIENVYYDPLIDTIENIDTLFSTFSKYNVKNYIIQEGVVNFGTYDPNSFGLRLNFGDETTNEYGENFEEYFENHYGDLYEKYEQICSKRMDAYSYEDFKEDEEEEFEMKYSEVPFDPNSDEFDDCANVYLPTTTETISSFSDYGMKNIYGPEGIKFHKVNWRLRKKIKYYDSVNQPHIGLSLSFNDTRKKKKVKAKKDGSLDSPFVSNEYINYEESSNDSNCEIVKLIKANYENDKRKFYYWYKIQEILNENKAKIISIGNQKIIATCEGSEGESYEIALESDGTNVYAYCSCPAYKKRYTPGTCKHVMAIKTIIYNMKNIDSKYCKRIDVKQEDNSE